MEVAAADALHEINNNIQWCGAMGTRILTVRGDRGWSRPSPGNGGRGSLLE
jgi:hypothetical protein